MKNDRVICPLGAHEILVETAVGTWLVAPSFNIDVAIGAIRDGMIEPWTTRLVQECLSSGQSYFNAGANYGYYAILGARIVGAQGRVYAVEPNPHVLPMLMKGAYWSGVIGQMSIYNRALWGAVGESVDFLFDPQYLGGGSSQSLRDQHYNDAISAQSFNDVLWSPDNVGSLFDETGKWIVGKGMFAAFKAETTTIDEIVKGARLDLLHLDIEGAEPFALLGALATIEANPQLKIITEWSHHTYRYGSCELKGAFDAVFLKLKALGYHVRHLEPRIERDGGIHLSEERDFEYMTTQAVHGDYFWTR
jgi:FkbM family methyltransferase